jgi:His/Glu/Gln/Arg/opine family amino acid ABC transporter permease subunit
MGESLSSDINLVIQSWPQLFEGLKVTVALSAIVIMAGTILGIIAGLILLYGPLVVRLCIRAYIDVIRGLPALVTLFIIFYGLPAAGINVAPFVAGAIALSAFSAAQIAEIMRGGIASIPRTQVEAGMAIGLTFRQRLRYVVFPQAIPRMIPPWTNSCVDIVKGTSLVALVSVVDLLLAAQQLLGRTFVAIPFYIVAALLYLIVNLCISAFGSWLMGRFAYQR